jgi:hypothetical protein
MDMEKATKKPKAIDTPTRFATWLNQQFDAVQAGDVDRPAILRETKLTGLRLGAGDMVGHVADDVSQTDTLASLGRLLAWCRAQPSLLWDATRTAAELGIGERTLWELSQSGEVPCIRVGRQLRYSALALKDWATSAAISA